MTVLLASVVDVTIVIALALAAAAAMRRCSAAHRHAVLTVAILAALIVPSLERFLPPLPLLDWDPDVAPVSSGVTATPAAEAAVAYTSSAPQAAPPFPWATLAAAIWLLGATLTLAGLLIDLRRLARLTARCVPLRSGPWRETADELLHASAIRRPVILLQSDDPSLLVVCGVLRPAIILPVGVASWSDDRRRIVLAHELAHVRRWDGAIQLAGEVLRILHWFNPLVWLCCRRLRHESEHACDDAVLGKGVEATEYASHLLGVAKHVTGARHAWVSASIAHHSTLEGRISAMLTRQRNRQPCTRLAWAGAVLAGLAVIVPLAAAGVGPPSDLPIVGVAPRGDVVLAVPAAATVQSSDAVVSPVKPTRPKQPVAPIAAAMAAQAVPTSVGGTVLDSSGAVLPGAALTLIDPKLGLQFSTVTDPNGRFAFPALRPGRYELAASLPGFATVTSVVPLSDGLAERVITLSLATQEQTVTVSCSVIVAAAAPSRRGNTVPQSTVDARPGLLGQVWNRALQAIFPVLSAQQARSGLPVRVGGVVRAAARITGATPVCPEMALPSPQVAVILVGHVDVDGAISGVRRAGSDGSPPAEFTESALDAVRQWTYMPALLNGEPTAVNVMINVVYRRT
ncbi:MAG TPA: M56 family metallopeptidase [Vicinamibacterales bacterium]|nr:M56 family metallopeptidase [Vicinamibacterales bacterium]